MTYYLEDCGIQEKESHTCETYLGDQASPKLCPQECLYKTKFCGQKFGGNIKYLISHLQIHNAYYQHNKKLEKSQNQKPSIKCFKREDSFLHTPINMPSSYGPSPISTITVFSQQQFKKGFEGQLFKYLRKSVKQFQCRRRYVKKMVKSDSNASIIFLFYAKGMGSTLRFSPLISQTNQKFLWMPSLVIFFL